MEFTVAPLPYGKEALEPHLGRETLEFHYEKHHKGYMTKLKGLIENTDQAQKSLVEVVKGSSGGVFNNAAQVWNHSFFWDGMKPGGGGAPTGDVAALIDRDFGGVAKFKEEFVKVGGAQFGSGWVWLVLDGGKGKIVSTANAETPLTTSATPLLTCDVWEHAYYLDYKNDRLRFLNTYLDHLVNWDFASKNLKK
jgi:Fe-Mn family superoxide dismutase